MRAAATERLRFDEVTEADLDDLLAIHAGNPEYAALTEGSQGEVGRYNRQMLERDWWLGTLEAARRQLIGRLDDGAAAVWLDLLDPQPERRAPVDRPADGGARTAGSRPRP